MYSWFSLCIRMTSEKVCTVLPESVSSGSRLINMTFIMKIVLQSLYPVRNHLTVETRARRTSVSNIGFSIPRKPRIKTYTVIPRTISSSLTNHSFSLWKWYFGLDIPSKKSSRFRNACRASKWWYHLISSSQIRYPNKTQKKSIKSPYQVGRHPNDQWKSDKLLALVITARRANSVLSFGFRYENDVRPWMFEQHR